MPERDPRELSTHEALDLIEQLAELDPGVLVLTGGDPLKRPDLFRLIAAATARNLSVAVAPSVTPLVTADVMRRLAAEGVRRIALSLDGPDASAHDAFRGTPGSFDATLDAIAQARDAGLSVQINTSLTRSNVWELPATGTRAASLAPDLWSVFFVVPTGRAVRAPQLDPDGAELVFDYLYDWSERTGLPVKTTAAPAFRRVVLQRDAAQRLDARTHRRMLTPVNDGKGFVFVSHTGDVYPSGFLPIVCGNVRRTSLSSIYRDSPLMRVLRDDRLLGGKCGVCPFRHVCGGSRARAYAVTGYVLAQDPACAYVPPAIGPATA
jgi:radical SAM protein